MEYQHALNIMIEARIHLPAIVKFGDTFHVFRRTDLLGSGPTIEAAMRAAKLFPPPDTKPVRLYVNVGSDVLQHGESVCVARNPNTAVRIVNALNRYKPSPKGF
jgi:hypothetical protein